MLSRKYGCLDFVHLTKHPLYTGGGVFSPKLYVDVPGGPQNLTFSILIFCPISHPSVYHFWKKHPILAKLGAFYNNLPKIYSIYVIWAPSSLMKPPDRYTNFAKKHPKRQAHIGIPCQCENLPGCTPLSCSPTWKHRSTKCVCLPMCSNIFDSIWFLDVFKFISFSSDPYLILKKIAK